jgi:hypothetical protein
MQRASLRCGHQRLRAPVTRNSPALCKALPFQIINDCDKAGSLYAQFPRHVALGQALCFNNQRQNRKGARRED